MALSKYKSVLIVDDSAMARNMATKFIKGLAPAIEIVQAKEAGSGFEMWEATRPDLAILDLNMPGTVGIGVGRANSQCR